MVRICGDAERVNIKTIVDEDFVNYKSPVMYIGTARCGGKCCIEAGIPLSVCHNDGWRSQATIKMADDIIIQRYIKNDLTNAICFAGLEPFEQFDEMFSLISKLRTEYNCDDMVVIYTGYNKSEISHWVETLKKYKNIIIKFGRYVPNRTSHYDAVLGVYLASDNQYAEKIS